MYKKKGHNTMELGIDIVNKASIAIFGLALLLYPS